MVWYLNQQVVINIFSSWMSLGRYHPVMMENLLVLAQKVKETK